MSQRGLASAYLARQRVAFDGRVFAALAAYNGGPGIAAVWLDLAGPNDDLLAEVVRYSETRTYLRRIYELYAIYRGVYAGGFRLKSPKQGPETRFSQLTGNPRPTVSLASPTSTSHALNRYRTEPHGWGPDITTASLATTGKPRCVSLGPLTARPM